MDELSWEPPGPGPWTQDSAHNPVSQTPLMQELYPPGFNRGFTEAFAAYGVLLDRLAMGVVNGFTYHQPQPFDLPGPDGPKDPAWIGEEFQRRNDVAARAFEERIWRDALDLWDSELKPASQALHRELGSVDLTALDDDQLHSHIRACCEQTKAMVYQHHRFNCHALVPVGDLLLQTAAWTGRPPMSMFGLLDGYSPISNVSPPEMQQALDALRLDRHAAALLDGDGDPGDVLAELRARRPEVDDYVRNVHFRLLEGFDVSNPTIGERPECLVGRLRVALTIDPNAARTRSDVYASEIRSSVPAEHSEDFDQLLAEARLVYRLRDERGLFSEISAVGLTRLGLLELGRRLHSRGRVKDVDDVLEAGVDDLAALIAGADEPTAEDLHERGLVRLQRTLSGAPRHLGTPPPPPPPVDMLPPPLARLMSSIGFLIDGILGELDEAQGTGPTIGGIAGARGVYEGTARLVRSINDLLDLEQGEVLVAPTTGEAFNSMLHLVGAIVTDHGSFASHAAIVSREMGIPAVVGTVDGTRRIAGGSRVRVDGDAGIVTLL